MVVFFFGLPIEASLVIPFLPLSLKRRLGWFCMIILALVFVCGLIQLPSIADGNIIDFRSVWIPYMGVDLSFVLDG